MICEQLTEMRWSGMGWGGVGRMGKRRKRIRGREVSSGVEC